jgi:hypothetical protein
MWNLTISFGPTGTVWAFLFKDKHHADEAYKSALDNTVGAFQVLDDFGQVAQFENKAVHGVLLEDLEQIEQARIQRALADERVKAKFMSAARSDPIIMAAARAGQNGPGVLTPFAR